LLVGHGQAIRTALIAAFGVVFLLWFASGYELARSIRQAEGEMALARQSFIRGQQVLTTVTTRVLQGAIYLRDALLEPDPEVRENYRAELTRLRADVEASLPEYLPQIDTAVEREQWANLQTALGAYWASREIALAEPSGVRASAAVIRSSLIPARRSILELINSLAALERESIDGHEQQMAAFYRDAETRVAALASLALAVGLVVAFVAARHVTSLQREIERRQAAERENRLDLERLSARLVSAQEEERRSLARELHDAVGQALSAIKMEIAVALRVGAGEPRAVSALNQARTIADGTLQNVRDLSQLLHPSMLDDLGLIETISSYLDGFESRSGIRAQLVHERMDDRLPPDVELCVYRVVQEALTNVARHSGASSCTVSLLRREGVLHVTIEDDGHGMRPSAAPGPEGRRGLGLIAMRERAQALSGSFSIENRVQGGTRILITIPFHAAAPEAPLEAAAG
jgi:signal transduction histidine kinase